MCVSSQISVFLHCSFPGEPGRLFFSEKNRGEEVLTSEFIWIYPSFFLKPSAAQTQNPHILCSCLTCVWHWEIESGHRLARRPVVVVFFFPLSVCWDNAGHLHTFHSQSVGSIKVFLKMKKKKNTSQLVAQNRWQNVQFNSHRRQWSNNTIQGPSNVSLLKNDGLFANTCSFANHRESGSSPAASSSSVLW